MRTQIATRRHRRRAVSRSILTLVTLLALAGMVLSPVGDQIALAQTGDQQAPPAEEVEEVENPDEAEEPQVPVQPTESPLVPPPITEVPLEGVEEPAPPTEMLDDDLATDEPIVDQVHSLTIDVYRCDHPTFDPYFSSNAQTVLDQCAAPGSGDFLLESTIPVPPQSGSSLEFQIGSRVVIQDRLAPGYDDPIANCFALDANGATIDQIGPAKTADGVWKVRSDSDVHCDWYQVDRGHGDVYIVNMACPQSLNLHLPNVPGSTLTMDQLVAACTEPAGPITFNVTYSGIYSMVDTSGGEFNDVFFGGVNSGPITIWEDTPPQFEQPIVYCQVNTVEGVELVPFAPAAVHDGRAVDWDLGHGQRLHCAWFNVPPGPGLLEPGSDPTSTVAPTVPPNGLSTLTIRKHTCPAGYDPEGPGASPMSDCPDGPNGVNFTLVDQDPDTVDLQTMTGDSIDNAVTFGGLAPGDYTVTETIPGGTAAVFVLGCGSGGGIDPIPVFVTNGTVDIGLSQGILLTCHWFNIPEVSSQPITREGALDATPGIAATLTGTASLTVYAYDCPTGFDVNTVDANPQTSCTPADGINLDLEDMIDDGGGWYFEIPTDGTGNDTITDLPEGRYTITGYVRDGTTATFAWDCYDLTGSSSRTDPLAMGAILTLDLDDGAQVRCDWFQVTGGAGRIVLNNHACGYLVPAYTLGLEQLGAQCTDDPGTMNFIAVADRYRESQPASKTPLVLASFANVPSGSVSVGVDLPEGWATPIVYCQVYLENGSPVSPPAEANVSARTASFLLEPGQVVYCDWYNVAQGFAEIHIASYACSPGFDAYAQDVSVCADDPGTVDFTVEGSRLYLETKPATGSTTADFVGVPSGKVRINETLPDGYGVPVVWCSVVAEDGTNVSSRSPMQVGVGTSITRELSAGQVLNCDWYNVPGGMGSVYIWTQACPPGLDVHAMSDFELDTYCTDDIPATEFLVASGSFAQYASSTDLSRYASFPAVPAGALTVTTETLPTGYGPPIVFCRAQESGLPATSPRKVAIKGESSISWDLEPGQDLYCRWRHVPYEETTGDNGRIVNYKVFCPEDVDAASLDLEGLRQACTETRGGVPFTVTNGNGFSRAAVTSGQTGVAIVENVPPSGVTIQETIPDGHAEPIVYCDSLPKDQRAFASIPMARIPAVNGAIEYTVEPMAEVQCHWFNVPGTDNTVTVIKRECPDDVAYDRDQAYYEATCTQKHEGIDFTLTYSKGTAVRTTDAGGTVQWADVPLGPFSVQEHIPKEYGEPVVFCFAGSGISLAQPLRMDTPGGYLEDELTTGKTYYTCHWYNVPGGPGEVTVHKYTCPPGYDLHASGADPREDCTDVTDGISFTLAGAAANIQDTTGADGTVRFDGLAPGPYSVTESVPDGTSYVFVLDCYGQIRGELRPYPLSMGETLAIDIGAGESIECYWYNAPDYEGGRLTVVKHQCSTETYVSDVDCEIYKDGQDFDLVYWNGEAWEYHSTQATDGVGRTTFVDLTPGEYWLDEHDREWCHMTSEAISDDGNWLNVYEGGETVVEVYNCGTDPDDQGKPGDTPTKYPNTGVPPDQPSHQEP